MYPVGMLLSYDDDVYRVLPLNRIVRLSSWNAVQSWNQPIIVGDVDVIEDNYTVTDNKLGYRPCSVIKSPEGERYYIEGGIKRKIPEHIFRIFGFNDFETFDASDSDLALHPTGDELG